MKLKKGDILLAGILVLLAAAALLGRRLLRQSGALVTVYVSGEAVASYPLDTERMVRLEAEGGGYNLLVISGGTASVTEASCPDKICVNTHSIRYAGESITCLPNRTVIRVEGPEGGVDIG